MSDIVAQVALSVYPTRRWSSYGIILRFIVLTPCTLH